MQLLGISFMQFVNAAIQFFVGLEDLTDCFEQLLSGYKGILQHCKKDFERAGDNSFDKRATIK